jgi:hypothetical protein
MPLSYDGSLLDHLAQHMIFLSTAPSFWYSLTSSYNHGFHLSRRLGMTPHDYERLLAAANLAHYHPKWGFTILVDRWKMFLDGHHFYSSNGTGSFEVEVATNRMDYNALPAGCCIISCRPPLLELTSSEPLTLDKEVRMQEEWHRDERKCTLIILARDLLLLDLDIVKDDRPSVAVMSPSRIPLP